MTDGNGGAVVGEGMAPETPTPPAPAEITPELNAEPIPAPEMAPITLVEVEQIAPPQETTAPSEPPVQESLQNAPPTEAPLPPAAEPTQAPSTQSQVPQVPPPSIASRLGEAFAALTGRKQKRLDKILTLFATKKSIKNDDVEKLLRVTDTSATNYLNELVRTGRLKRVGNSHQPTYELP